MSRSLCLFGVAAIVLSACGNENTIGVVDGEIVVGPGLTDKGTVPVGETVSFTINAAHDQGATVTITDVSVTNIEGSFFTYLGDKTMEVGDNESIDLPFEYTPTEVGYHRATVQVTNNGRVQEIKVDVRAHAVLPEATVWPLGLDFGPVDPGNTSSRQLTVANQSDLDLTLNDYNISNGVFELTTSLPVTIGGGNEQVISLLFRPTDSTPQLGSLTLRAGDVGLPQVQLRGNDCENGDPEAYDQDGDGYTMCGGDCDDLDMDAHPGAQEVANAIDDDCDGDVDEDTPWADDDGDGYCDDPGYCSDGSMPGDCSDSSDPSANTDAVNPGAVENMNNGIDDDCDGVVDQGTTDADGDGYSPAGGDCDDTNGTVFPGAPELPDFLDNDCDVPARIDEGTVYYDDDGDGYCEHATTCSDGSMTGDCDDDTRDADGNLVPDGRPTNPGAVELADWRDNDCDGTVDEGTNNYDDDGDGYTETGGDCNDSPVDANADGVPDGAAYSPALGNCP